MTNCLQPLGFFWEFDNQVECLNQIDPPLSYHFSNVWQVGDLKPQIGFWQVLELPTLAWHFLPIRYFHKQIWLS